MASLGSLWIELALKADNFLASVKNAQNEAKAMERTLKPLGDMAQNLGAKLTALGGVAAGSFTLMAKRAADLGDNMLDLSKKTGIGMKELSAYELLAKKSGTSFDGLSAGLTKLNRTIFEGATGSKEQAEIFSAMGIALRDSSGQIRETSDILPQLAARFAQLEDGATKTALSVKVFGKAGADLIPFLNEGPAGLRQAAEETQKFNRALTEADGVMGDKFNESVTNLKTATDGLSFSVGRALLPSMTSAVDKGAEFIAWVSKMADEFPTLTRVIAGAAFAITGAGGLLLGFSGIVHIAPTVNQSLQLIGLSLTTVGKISGVVGGAILGTVAAFKSIESIAEKGAGLVSGVGALQFGPIGALAGSVAAIKNLISGSTMDLPSIKSGDAIAKAAELANQAILVERSTKEAEGWVRKLMEAMGKTASSAKDVRDHIYEFVQVTAEIEEFPRAVVAVENAASRFAAALQMAKNRVPLGDQLQRAEDSIYGSVAGKLDRDSADLAGVLSARTEYAKQNVDKLINSQQTYVKQTESQAQRLSKAWEVAAGNITSSMSNAFADMVVTAKFNFDSLVGIAQQTARGMLSAFLSGMLSPLTESLAGLGRRAAGLLSGASAGVPAIAGMNPEVAGLLGISLPSLGGTGAAAGAAGAKTGLLAAFGGATGLLATAGLTVGPMLVQKLFPSTPGGRHLLDFLADGDLKKRFRALNAAGFNDEFESISAQHPFLSARATIEMVEAMRSNSSTTHNVTNTVAPVFNLTFPIGTPVEEIVRLRKVLENNTQGFTEFLTKKVKDNWDGVS